MSEAGALDAVFHALSSSARRRMLDIVKERPGCSVNDVCAYFEMSRIAVLKHIRVLEAANLLTSEKDWRTRRLFFNAVPIQMIYDRWTSEYSSIWAARLTRLKYRVEQVGESGAKPSRSKSQRKRAAGRRRKGRNTGKKETKR